MLKEERQETLYGILDLITYQNDENSYMVGRLLQEKTNRPIAFAGKVYNVSVGESIQIQGKWTKHQIYGNQFKVSSFAPRDPYSIEGIKRYLFSSRFPGIGEKTALQIVNSFKEKTIEIIDKTPEKLLALPLVSPAKLATIKKSRSEYREEGDAYIFLHHLHLSPALIRSVFELYGIESIPIIKENPYRLAHEIKGIGFKIADSIANYLEIPRNSPGRIEAALLFFLEQLSLDGHCCYPESELIEQVLLSLNEDITLENEIISLEMVEQAVEKLLNYSLLEVERISPIKRLLFLKKYFYLEKKVSQKVKLLLQSPNRIKYDSAEKEISQLEESLKIQLHTAQKKAVLKSISQKILILTGGPGTGKTTIIKFILKYFSGKSLRIMLAAPTGKAAKRMSETTNYEVKTIHRLLEISGKGPQKNADNQLECDLLILDEASMIDISLFNKLIEAIPEWANLILVGDVDQLPSVGAGALLRDLLDCPNIPRAVLTKIFRQSQESQIISNSHLIIQGREIKLSGDSRKEKLSDFYFIDIPKLKNLTDPKLQQKTDQYRVINNLVKLFLERIPKRFAINQENIQILTPVKNGVLGTININRIIQQELFKGNKNIEIEDQLFYKGDRVIQNRNNYDLQVFNGDQGVIIDFDENSLLVDFDGNEVNYNRQTAKDLSLAWAITIHKSQGSEYSAVIVVITDQHHIMLQRNLIYTAITRGKKLVTLIGEKNALKKSIKREKNRKRYTFLAERLKELFA